MQENRKLEQKFLHYVTLPGENNAQENITGKLEGITIQTTIAFTCFK